MTRHSPNLPPVADFSSPHVFGDPLPPVRPATARIRRQPTKREASDLLDHALQDAAEHYLRIPCTYDPDAWTGRDPHLRALAAESCIDCPVFRECRTYARIWRETWGVWAGIDRSIEHEDAA